jgi:DNA primase
MSQRVMLAQQQLQLASAAPQLHNLREAYRRMYAAMGVDNVDAILKPDPDQPQPVGPATENGAAMKGQPPKAFPMQDHMAHISAHSEFMFTRMVQINPQLYALLQAHMSEHIALMAGQQINEQYKDQVQQLQQQMQQVQAQAQQNPQAQQMMQQMQQQNDQLTNEIASAQAKLEAELTANFAKAEEQRMAQEPQDPLVKLKQQEIDLKAMETQARLQKDLIVDTEKMDLERDKLEADTSLELMKVSAEVNKQSNADATAMLKENMISAREAMKDKTAERIARENARSKTRKAD